MTERDGTRRASRIVTLDALRGLAALAVVLYHYGFRSAEIYPDLGPEWRWTSFGQYGVQLFFLISGFVIFMTLQRATPRSFAISRFIRLYPIYWVCVLVTTIVVAAFGLPGRAVSSGDTLANFTMLQQYLGVPPVDGAYWTLAAELGFYVQVGIVFFCGLLRPGRLVPVLYVWALVATGLTQVDKFLPFGGALFEAAAPAFVWIPLFLTGIAFHQIWQGGRGLALLLLPAFAVALMTLRGSTIGLAVVGVMAVFILALRFMTSRLTTLLTYLGAISYPLYLVHQNIGYVVMRGATSHGLHKPLAVGLALATVLLLALALTYLVDQPLRAGLTRRLLRRTSTPRVRPNA